MTVKTIKKADHNPTPKKKSMACDMMIDEAPMHQQKDDDPKGKG